MRAEGANEELGIGREEGREWWSDGVVEWWRIGREFLRF